MTSSQPSDLDLLRATFSSWEFGSVWSTAASGPDHRHLVAVKGDVVLTAWDAESLASQIVAAGIAAALQDGES